MEGETASDGKNIYREAQGSGINRRKIYRAAEMGRELVQLEITSDSMEDVISHGLWKRGTTAMFGIIISNLNAESYLPMMLEEAIAEADKYKKDKYLQACL